MAGKKGAIKMNQDYQEELLHLESCLSLIQENIRLYEAREQASRKEVTALFQAVRKGEGDSYGQLIASQNILEHLQNSLRKNRAALDQPYFGRIVYDDLTYDTSECCYIGKNGISRNQTDVAIVDWRAPVANVYYENELGKGCYAVPGSDDVEIDLHQKRTYDISNGQLHGYYDDDIAAKRYGRLCKLFGKHAKTRALTAGKQHSHYFLFWKHIKIPPIFILLSLLNLLITVL